MPKPLNVNDRYQLYAEYERCKRAAEHFERVRICAVNGLAELNVYDRDHVQELIGWLELAIAEMRKVRPPRDGQPDPRTAQQRIQRAVTSQRSINVAGLSHAALTVYFGGDKECLSLYLHTFLGSGADWRFEIGGKQIYIEKIPVFSQALVESLLKQTKGWREAEDPLAYIAAQCRRMAWKQAKQDAPLEEKDTVPLDDIVGTPAESGEAGVTVERVYSFEAFKDEARRRGDLELLAYIEGMEASVNQGFDKRAAHRQIRSQMGWNKFEASKIRVRFLRLFDTAAEYVTHGHPAISDASRNVFFEIFYRAGNQRIRGDWKHKNPPRRA